MPGASERHFFARSVTITKRPSIQSALRTATMFGCESRLAMRASCSTASGPHSAITSGLAIFRATRRFSMVSRASHTVAKLPLPSFFSRAYFPSREPLRRGAGVIDDRCVRSVGEEDGARSWHFACVHSSVRALRKGSGARSSPPTSASLDK